MAVLAVNFYGNKPGYEPLLDVVAEVLITHPDRDLADKYTELMLRVLSGESYHYLEDLMRSRTFEFTSPYAQARMAEGEAKGLAKGEALGEARSILRVLEKRSVKVSDEVRARITSCTDQDVLLGWLDRALEVTTAEQIFD